MNEKKLAKYFQFLDNLRESGETNMYGARPYLMQAYPELDKELAGKVLSSWMAMFNPTISAEVRAHDCKDFEKPKEVVNEN